MHLKATTEDPLFAHFFYQSPKPVSLINIWSEYFIVITLLNSSAISKYKHFLKTKDPLLTDILEYGSTRMVTKYPGSLCTQSSQESVSFSKIASYTHYSLVTHQ